MGLQFMTESRALQTEPGRHLCAHILMYLQLSQDTFLKFGWPDNTKHSNKGVLICFIKFFGRRFLLIYIPTLPN